MDAEIRAKWCAALRSGLYEQGKEYLRDGNAYCCLGVLQALTGLDRDVGDELLDYDQAAGIGLDSRAQDTLSKMNDDGASFEEIAEWIETHLQTQTESPS